MKTVQMTLDEELLKAVDRAAKKLHTNRSAFAREALRAALRRYSAAELEKKHREGYRKQAASPDEFRVWEGEQAWGGE